MLTTGQHAPEGQCSAGQVEPALSWVVGVSGPSCPGWDAMWASAGMGLRCWLQGGVKRRACSALAGQEAQEVSFGPVPEIEASPPWSEHPGYRSGRGSEVWLSPGRHRAQN